jgi:hypothetical protein
MQMSIMPNITIYGDVNPKDINKGLIRERIGLGKFVNRKAIATSEKNLAVYKESDKLTTRTKKGGQYKHELIVASG